MTALTWNGLELEASYDSDPGSWTEQPWEEVVITSASIEDLDEFYDAFGEGGLNAFVPGWRWGETDDEPGIVPPANWNPVLNPSDVDSILSDDQRRDLMEQVR